MLLESSLGAIGLLTALFFLLRLPEGKASSKFQNMIVGHRGCRRFPNVPENSLAAFQFAISNGAAAIELDCRLTADGHVVVFHDDALFRLCLDSEGNSASGYLSDTTLTDLQKLRYKENPDSTECIPLLADVLMLAKTKGVSVFVELKSMYVQDAKPLAAAVATIFSDLDAAEFACVIAFSPLVVYWVRALAPSVETCILYSDDFYSSSVHNRLEKVSSLVEYSAGVLDWLLRVACIYAVPAFTGCTMIGPDSKIVSQKEVQGFTARGLSVYVWVANAAPEMDLFLSLGCSVGTDKLFPVLTAPHMSSHEAHMSDMLTRDMPPMHMTMPVGVGV